MRLSFYYFFQYKNKNSNLDSSRLEFYYLVYIPRRLIRVVQFTYSKEEIPSDLLYLILKFLSTILNVVKLCSNANKFDGNTFINPKNISELLIDTVLLTLLLI